MPSHLQTMAVQDLLFRRCYTKLCSEILLEIRVSEQDFPLLEVENIRNSSLLLLWFILSKWCFLRPVKSWCLFYVAFWEALLREAKSQRSVGESVKLKDFTGMKVHRSEFILLINSKHLMALQKSFPGWRCLINFVIDYDKSKHPRFLWISKLSVFFKSEEDILKPSSLHCCAVNFWCIKTFKKSPTTSAVLWCLCTCGPHTDPVGFRYFFQTGYEE